MVPEYQNHVLFPFGSRQFAGKQFVYIPAQTAAERVESAGIEKQYTADFIVGHTGRRGVAYAAAGKRMKEVRILAAGAKGEQQREQQRIFQFLKHFANIA